MFEITKMLILKNYFIVSLITVLGTFSFLLENDQPRNRHCANCIGALSFHIAQRPVVKSIHQIIF